MACAKTKLIKNKSDCPNKAPGVVRLLLAERKWLDTLPAREDYFADQVANKPLTISTDVTLNTTDYADAKWIEWHIQPKKNGLIQTAQGETGAKYWQSNLEFSIAGQDELIDQSVDWALSADLVALAYDRAGKLRLVGDNTNGLEMLNAEGNTGKADGDFIGWNLTLQCPAHNLLWPYYTGAVTPIDAI